MQIFAIRSVNFNVTYRFHLSRTRTVSVIPYSVLMQGKFQKIHIYDQDNEEIADEMQIGRRLKTMKPGEHY